MRLSILLASAGALALALSSASAQVGPAPGGTSYTAGSGLTLTGTVFSLGDANLTYGAGAVNTYGLALSGSSTTGSSTHGIGYSVAGTMNTSGVVDGAAFFSNITNTASGVGSTLFDLQLSSSSYMKFDTIANLTIGTGASNSSGNQILFNIGSGANNPGLQGFLNSATPEFIIEASNSAVIGIYASGAIMGNSKFLGFNNTGAGGAIAPDVLLNRDGPGVLADRNSTSAQALRVAGSFTDASNYSWAGIVAEQTGGSEACAANTFCLGSYHLGTPGGGGNMTKFGLYVDGTLRLDYAVTTLSVWTMNGSLVSLGLLQGTNHVSTTGPSTVAAGQISYGGTTSAASSCGSLAGSAGCININVAGTARFVPYY